MIPVPNLFYPPGKRLPVSRLFILALIVLVGFALRAHNAGQRSLWEDEGWTMLLSQGPSLGDVTRTLAADQHPPLYFVLFRVWRDAAGDSEFAGRFFGVLIGVLAIAGMYRLGRVLVGPRAGVMAALLFALADLPIDLAQEIRHYSLLTTLSIYSSLFYVRWWRTPRRSVRLGYVAASLALIYTHYLGAFVLMAQAVHLLLVVRPWRRLREGLFLLGAIGAGFLPWLPVMIDQNRLRWDNPLYYQNALPNTRETFLAVSDAVIGHHAALLGGLALVGLFVLARPPMQARLALRLRPAKPAVFLILWIGLMTVITILVNERRQFLTVRNFVIIVPPLLVLAGRGLSILPRATRWFMITLVVVVSLTTVDARRYYPDWRSVVANITRYHLANEPVLIDVWVGDFPARYYIDRQMGPDVPRVSLREWRDRYKDQFLPALLGELQTLDSFWLISWNDNNLGEYGHLIERAGFQRTANLSIDHLGTPNISSRYDRLTDAPLAHFGDLFTLRKANAPLQATPGDSFTIGLWWSAEQPVALDYSVSVFVLNDAGVMVAQHDSSPLEGRAPTSRWQPGQVIFDAHTLTLSAQLPPGDYTLAVRVYWYGDGQPLPVRLSASGDLPDTGDYAPLGTLAVR